jgi:hypothetical protein
VVPSTTEVLAQNFGIVLITLNERPMNVWSGFFVGRADLQSEAVIGKKEVKRSHRNIP